VAATSSAAFAPRACCDVSVLSDFGVDPIRRPRGSTLRGRLEIPTSSHSDRVPASALPFPCFVRRGSPDPAGGPTEVSVPCRSARPRTFRARFGPVFIVIFARGANSEGARPSVGHSCGVRRPAHNKVHPNTETAQQISPISQDQIRPKICTFHHASIRGGGDASLRHRVWSPSPPPPRQGPRFCVTSDTCVTIRTKSLPASDLRR
jgi:hypothetical protein